MEDMHSLSEQASGHMKRLRCHGGLRGKLQISNKLSCMNHHPEAEELVFSHFVICNDTHETLRFGQVDTDENVLLASLHSHQYSWRSHKSPQLLHICIEGWGNWRWSEPFNVDNVGTFIRTIQYKGRTASLIIKVQPLNGVQKQIIICGRQIMCSYLSRDIELRVVQHYVGPDGQTVVKEHVDCLAARLKTPSYVLENTELTELCVRARGDDEWSRDVHLESCEHDSSTIVQVPCSNGMLLYVWCTVMTLEPDSQVQQRMVVFSPLFIMRSHLPDPVIIHIEKRSLGQKESQLIPGQGQEETLLNVESDLMHHLTFQASPLFIMRSHLPDPVIIHIEKRSLGQKESQLIPGQGQEETLLNVESDLMHHLTFQAREEDDASQCAVPISTALIKQIVTKTQGTGTQAQILSDFYTADSSSHLPWPYIKKDSYRSTVEQLAQWDSPMQVKLSAWKPCLNTLLIELLPWALLVNQSKWDLWLFEGEKIVLQIPAGKVIIPPNFKEPFQIGIYWANTNTVHKSTAVKLAHDFTSPKWKDDTGVELLSLDEEGFIDAEIKLGAFPGHQKVGAIVLAYEEHLGVTYMTLTEDPCPRMIINSKCPVPLVMKENIKAIVLAYEEHLGVTYMTLTEDPCPRMIINSKCPVPLVMKENIKDIPKTKVHCRPIPAESSLHHELYHHLSSFPDCKNKDTLPSILLKLESSEETGEEWSDAIDINSPGTQW
ncbi:UNVERIFIED_CONTAM: hypothetical protein FKN15_016979 [Acipenser sinensis]